MSTLFFIVTTVFRGKLKTLIQKVAASEWASQTGYLEKLVRLVAHLLPMSPALGPEHVSEIDRVYRAARFLVQRRLLTDPVENLPL